MRFPLSHRQPVASHQKRRTDDPIWLTKDWKISSPLCFVELYSSDARNPYGFSSYQDYLSFRDQGEVFSGLAAYRPGRYKLGGEDGMDPVIGEAVSGNYFDVLGVKAFSGRTFLPEEDRTPGSHPVAVIGHDLWRRRFGADPALIGKPIKINNQALTVIGIAPPEYTGMLRGLAAEVWSSARSSHTG
jgi:hypothetical protein